MINSMFGECKEYSNGDVIFSLENHLSDFKSENISLNELIKKPRQSSRSLIDFVWKTVDYLNDNSANEQTRISEEEVI